ncbi:hypothetical protein RAD15_00045 [Bradyrhizobium sp. 14AA]
MKKNDLSIFGMKRGLHSPQLSYPPQYSLDDAVIKIRKLDDELLVSVDPPVEDQTKRAHSLQLPSRNIAFFNASSTNPTKISNVKLMVACPFGR